MLLPGTENHLVRDKERDRLKGRLRENNMFQQKDVDPSMQSSWCYCFLRKDEGSVGKRA